LDRNGDCAKQLEFAERYDAALQHTVREIQTVRSVVLVVVEDPQLQKKAEEREKSAHRRQVVPHRLTRRIEDMGQKLIG
jgi:hypothetical protein